MLRAFRGKSPTLDPTAFVEASAHVIGDVTLGARASVWFNAVVRGDVGAIVIGEETNLQDLCVVHVTGGKANTTVGARVTVGHAATLHGCTIEDLCLIGIGSTVLDRAVIGAESMVAAGSLVTPGTIVPPRSLVMGAPAKVRRALTDAELAHLRESAANYVTYAQFYQGGG